MMETYLLRVRFLGSVEPSYTIELKENQTLVNLHDAIQNALGWDNDHLYSFYFKPKPSQTAELRKAVNQKYRFMFAGKKKPGKRTQGLITKWVEKDLKRERIEYSHPYELEDYQRSAEVELSKLKLAPKEKFEYLFDYGDCHRFEVMLLSKGESSQNTKYPHLLEKKGKSPKQY